MKLSVCYLTQILGELSSTLSNGLAIQKSTTVGSLHLVLTMLSMSYRITGEGFAGIEHPDRSKCPRHIHEGWGLGLVVGKPSMLLENKESVSLSLIDALRPGGMGAAAISVTVHLSQSNLGKSLSCLKFKHDLSMQPWSQLQY